MMTYNATVMSNDEFAEITGQHPKFKDGFITNNCDWWESLEKYLKKPIFFLRQEMSFLIIMYSRIYPQKN